MTPTAPPPNPDFAAGMERAAEIADLWADTRPKSGPLAPVIAQAMSECAKTIAAAIREAAKTPPREKE